jgi:hypothetical protein
MDNITRRKVFAGVFIEGFVELPDQLLEDCPHRRVIKHVGVEVHLLEALKDLEQQPSLLIVLSKANFSKTSCIFGLKPLM